MAFQTLDTGTPVIPGIRGLMNILVLKQTLSFINLIKVSIKEKLSSV
jgi:hypothetical protein